MILRSPGNDRTPKRESKPLQQKNGTSPEEDKDTPVKTSVKRKGRRIIDSDDEEETITVSSNENDDQPENTEIKNNENKTPEKKQMVRIYLF